MEPEFATLVRASRRKTGQRQDRGAFKRALELSERWGERAILHEHCAFLKANDIPVLTTWIKKLIREEKLDATIFEIDDKGTLMVSGLDSWSSNYSWQVVLT